MIEEAFLNNGIQVIHQENTNTKVGHVGVFINVGSRDEEKGEEGVAHYLEHVIFKGTKKKKSLSYFISTRFCWRRIKCIHN
jgi:predicted Zn-dependent peptidase